MSVSNDLEDSTRLVLDFSKIAKIGAAGVEVLPVVVQDVESREVLIVAYVNAEALRLSLAEKRAIFYSTSRGEIWRKGDSSGDVMALREVRVNCEQNSLLYLVSRTGGTCHTKDATGHTRASCYYRRVLTTESLEFILP